MEDTPKRKPVTDALRASEERFRQLYNTTPAMMHSIDRDARLVSVSDYWLKALGYTRDDVLGHPLTEFMTQASRRYAHEVSLPRFYRDGFVMDVPLQFVKKNGDVIETLLSATTVSDDAGNFLRSMAVITDVTERKRAEQALRQSEEHFRNLIEGSIQGILIDRNRKPIFVNQNFAAILGYASPAEILAMESMDPCVAPHERARLKGYTEARLKGKSAPIQYEYDALRKDGAIVTLQNLVRVIEWEGQPAIQSTVIDVTQRKRAEEALRESEKRVRLLLESTNAIPWEANIDTWQFTYVGPQAVKLLGYPVEKWYEKDFWPAHIHPEDREFAIDFCEKSAHRLKNYEFEYRMIAADGNIVWLHDIVSVVSVNGRPRTLRGFMIDITERKRAEEALRQSEARYRNLIEGSVQGIVIDRNRKPIFVNKSFADILGYDSNDEILAMASMDPCVAPHERPRLKRYTEARSKGKQAPTQYEYDALRKDGSIATLQNVVRVITWEGEPAIQNTVIDVTERKRAERGLRERTKRLEGLIRTSAKVAGTIETNETLNAIAKEAANLLRIDGAGFRLLEGDRLVVAGSHGLARNVMLTPSIEVGESLTGRVARDGRAIAVPDLRHEQRFHEEHKKAAMVHGIVAYLGVPLRYRDRITGVLNVYGKERHTFPEEEISLLQAFADQAAVAIERARLYGRAKHHAEELQIEIAERKRAQGELEEALTEVARLKDHLQAENIYLREEIDLDHHFGEIIGQDKCLKKVFLKVEQVAVTDATVLILGETGTGKELLARAIHGLSQRKDRPLVKVSCAALPPSLIESELFGHERGAFTGAVSRQVGRFELANGATIFLDEVGELPLNLQAKLLRVLQDGEFERLGNPRTFKVDVRIIAATNRDLEGAVRNGGFRTDLYHRLSVFPLVLPPLRERRGDIPPLVQSFVTRYGQKLGKAIDTIPQPTMTALQAYSWPGNVRELENVIERAVIVTQGPTLRVEDTLDPRPAMASELTEGQTLEDIEREHINRILQQTQWRIEGRSGAAVVLGLNPGTLRSRIRKLGIRRQ